MDNIVSDQTSDQPEQDLSAIVGEIAAEGLQKQSFHRLSYEAYSTINGSDRLRSLVSDWGVVAGSIPSTADAGAILGYFQMILGDLDAAQATLESNSGSDWASYWLCRVLLEKKMPGDEMLEALLIVLAGLVLITPGFLTDAVGFMLLIPATRVRVRDWLRNRFHARFIRKHDDDIIIQQ